MATSTSLLTPLQLTAGSSLLQNQGIAPNVLEDSIAVYTSTPVMAPFIATVNVGLTGNVFIANTVTQLETLSASSCPAFSDSIPTAYASTYPTELLTTLLINTANRYLGNGDVGKFAQALSIAQSYQELTNLFINSAHNAQTYMGDTFTSINNMTTGDITAVNLCTAEWGNDLANLGLLINLNNLDEMGSPVGLIKQLASIGGIIPVLPLLFTAFGVSQDVVVNLKSPSLSASVTDQKIMYAAMTNVTGEQLSQVLQVLGVKTANINSMADLLNPYKIFPNSFLTLTFTDVNNVSQRIYVNNTGTVNSAIEQALPTTIKTYGTMPYESLAQIIPNDQALANKALATGMKGITGIASILLPKFAAAVSNVQTNFGLTLINAETAPINSATANYYQNTLAHGTGTNGTILITDILGTAAGVEKTQLSNTVVTFSTMDLTALTTVYQTMENVVTGVYGEPYLGPVVIPPGTPGAGTYVATTEDSPNPTPPPANVTTTTATAADNAFVVLIPLAQADIDTLISTYPSQTTTLNNNWTAMMNQLALEQTTQTAAGLNYGNLVANSKDSIYSLIFSLPSYGQDTTVGGMSQFMEGVSDLTNIGGQAIVASLRQGQSKLSASGIGTSSNVPAAPNPAPPEATLLPAQYPYPNLS